MSLILTGWTLLLVFFMALIYRIFKYPDKIILRASIFSLTITLIFFAIATINILITRSSTAAIGFIFLPFYTLVPGFITYYLSILYSRYRQNKSENKPAYQQIIGITFSTIILVILFIWQFSVLHNTSEINTARDILNAKREIAIKGNEHSIHLLLKVNEGNEAQLLTELADKNTDDTMLIPIAKNKFSPPELLDRLSRYDNSAINISVIRNPNTAPETLEWLYYHSKYPEYYYSDLARNINTPKIILRELYQKRYINGGITWSLASNESTPVDILKLLATESDENVIDHLKNNNSYNQIKE